METQKTKQTYIRNANKHRTKYAVANGGFQYKEFTPLVFADCLLPGKWGTVEVESEAKGCRHSYAMKTPLHPNIENYDYVDFWGNVNPYGKGCHQVFICIYENDPGYMSANRWTVTTGRYTHLDMSTNKFDNLEDAIKFMVQQMEKTQLKFDKILNEKTLMWDFDAIRLHNIEWDIRTNAISSI